MKKIWLSSFSCKNGDELIKYCNSDKHAKKLSKLYKEFPNHVYSLKVNGNRIFYEFVYGNTLNDIIKEKKLKPKFYYDLGKFLSKIHFSNKPIKIENYEEVCKRRNLHPNKNKIFTKKAYSFISKIHGDLTTKHIIIKNKNFYFIERFRNREDIFFDFPIFLSLLCFYKITNSKYFLKCAKSFLEGYRSNSPNDKEFWRGFFYNLLNYCYFTSGYTHKFGEWSYSIELAKDLEKHKDIWEYLEKELNN